MRDRRDGLVGDLPIDEKRSMRRYAEIETIADLRLVDLREDRAIRMGGADGCREILPPLPRAGVVACFP
ncbi:hypothetical protein [Sinorhizobium numidicum]|uniref:hypothetical protein n=1 Tax=Sinorhizobium numidicum TaxID=680248 RepID=UPI0031450FFE